MVFLFALFFFVSVKRGPSIIIFKLVKDEIFDICIFFTFAWLNGNTYFTHLMFYIVFLLTNKNQNDCEERKKDIRKTHERNRILADWVHNIGIQPPSTYIFCESKEFLVLVVLYKITEGIFVKLYVWVHIDWMANIKLNIKNYEMVLYVLFLNVNLSLDKLHSISQAILFQINKVFHVLNCVCVEQVCKIEHSRASHFSPCSILSYSQFFVFIFFHFEFLL